MNRENLQRMADYIRTIPQERFEMGFYSISDFLVKDECETIGCVIGHCIKLDPTASILIKQSGFNFYKAWSEQFTEIDSSNASWTWLFDCVWADVDNTPEGAALRIEWLLNNGLPENWHDQLLGVAPLCYK